MLYIMVYHTFPIEHQYLCVLSLDVHLKIVDGTLPRIWYEAFNVHSIEKYWAIVLFGHIFSIEFPIL